MDALRDRYRWLLAETIVLVLVSSILIYTIIPTPPGTRVDTSFYQHAGWYIAHGAVPYVEIWDVKPPLHFEFQSMLALISGDNMYLLHGLNILLSSLALAGTVLFTAELVRDLTRDRIAALASGLMLLSFPFLYIYASMGFRNKLYVLFTGSLSILLQSRKRPFWSGIFSSVALGFWQFGIVFPIMSLIMAFEESDHVAIRRTLIGILLAGLLIMLPVFYWGAFEAMVVEAIVVPLIMEEPFSIPYRVLKLITWADYAVITMAMGFVGAVLLSTNNTFNRTAWFTVGFVMTLLQVFIIDLDSHADGFLLMFFVAIGMGYLTHWMKSSYLPYLVTLLMASLLINWGTHMVKFRDQPTVPLAVKQSFLSLVEEPPSNHSDFSSMIFARAWERDDFWNRRIPETCHYRLSTDEKEWIKMTDQSAFHKECGRWEYLTRYWSKQGTD